jgi:DNA polymerase (family 10)
MKGSFNDWSGRIPEGRSMENIQIAKTFEQVADLLEIQGANPFRVRAYRNAARTIGALGTPVDAIVKHNGHALEELPGIGADLAGKISRMCRTGELPLLAQLTRKTPESLVAMLRIPGVGPKRAKLIYRKSTRTSRMSPGCRWRTPKRTSVH